MRYILKSRNISNAFAESEFPCESAESVNAQFKDHCSHSKYFPLIFKDFESEEGLLLCKRKKIYKATLMNENVGAVLTMK